VDSRLEGAIASTLVTAARPRWFFTTFPLAQNAANHVEQLQGALATQSIGHFGFLDTQKGVRYASHFCQRPVWVVLGISQRSNCMFNLRNRLIAILFAVLSVSFQPSVLAQDTDTETALDDFIHYSLVANVDLAEAYALALIRDKVSNEDFYSMVIATKERYERFDRAIGWALFVPDLEPLASTLEDRFEAGRISVIRNADKLQEAIELLNGTTRQRILADERLQEAGEYAVPFLLRALMNSENARTTKNAREMLTTIGRDAVLPLSASLPHLDSGTKVLVSKILGDIGYKHAAPALIVCANNESNAPNARAAAANALAMLGIDKDSNLSTQLTVVANRFYDAEGSLQPEPVAGSNLFWVWDPEHKLIPLDVPEEVFFDVLAMHFASLALDSDVNNAAAMSTFVGANLRRDRTLAGRTDLVFGGLAYSPAFYATVFGPEIAQLVLDKALNDRDTSLALDAIAALARTAGAESLLGYNGQPIVTSMYYPDRKVQYESALTLAATLPTEKFEGSYRVVPLLASAIRNGGELYALVVGDDADQRRELRTLLDSDGWNVVGEGVSGSQAVETAGIVPGIDLVAVIARNAEHGQFVVSEIAAMPQTTVTPVLLLSDGTEYQALATLMEAEEMVETAHVDVSDSSKLAVIEDLIHTAAGGRLNYEEQQAFSNRALAVLRDIALADTVLQVDDATGTLIEAMTVADADARAIIAQTLSMIGNELAQRALVDAALVSDQDVDQRVMLLDEAAGSVRRWGNLSQGWQVELVVDLAENSNGDLADAAARLNGALNHPNTSVMIFLP
jgi:hypothetical protein